MLAMNAATVTEKRKRKAIGSLSSQRLGRQSRRRVTAFAGRPSIGPWPMEREQKETRSDPGTEAIHRYEAQCLREPRKRNKPDFAGRRYHANANDSGRCRIADCQRRAGFAGNSGHRAGEEVAARWVGASGSVDPGPVAHGDVAAAPRFSFHGTGRPHLSGF